MITIKTTLIDWGIQQVKTNLPALLILVMGLIIYYNETERRKQTFETLTLVRKEKESWKALALNCQGIDPNKIAEIKARFAKK